MIKAETLVPGDSFKLPGQRKYREVLKTWELGNKPGIPEAHRGKLLVVFSDCKQTVLAKDQEVIILTK